MKPKETTKAPLSEALLDAMAAIQKSHGNGSIMRMGDRIEVPIEGISTGSVGLDIAIGGKGLPRGRVIEVFGPESSGKTTLTLHVVANAQRSGGVCAFIDAEHALDPQYAKRLGVDLDSLLISQPDHGEQALDICETLVKSGAVDVIVIDSVAALVPKAEIEGEMGDSFVGLQARLMSQALRKLTALTAKSKTTLVYINQNREKIGVMFGSPETTTGGRALKFYSSVRIDIRRIGQIKDGEEPIGARTKATVVKNKVAPPFKKCEFDILFAEGINRLGEVLDIGVESGFLKRSGTWISYGETRLGQGREKAREFLKENPALAKEIEEALVARVAKRELDAANPSGAGTTGAANSGHAGAGGSAGAAGSGSSGSGSSGAGSSGSGAAGSGAGGGPAAAGARSTASRQQAANP
ncbi:MAG: recombinase RecA [Planctomycetes bacterium]|nr:recombinase RecA [Planctomycetota bacterium]